MDGIVLILNVITDHVNDFRILNYFNQQLIDQVFIRLSPELIIFDMIMDLILAKKLYYATKQG